MSPPVLYTASISPPCRGVLIATGAAEIEVDAREIKLQYGEHRKEEFLKMNPQHTIPTLNDNGFILADSHAIVTYLIDKYAKDDSLYPKDLEKRAVINQRLHFDNASLFPNLKKIIISLITQGTTKAPQHMLNEVEESYGFLEKFLGDNDWLAGNTYTLADTSTIASVSTLAVSTEHFGVISSPLKKALEFRTIKVPPQIVYNPDFKFIIRMNAARIQRPEYLQIFAPFDKYPKLTTWVKRCEENIPGCVTANEPGLAIIRDLVRARVLRS